MGLAGEKTPAQEGEHSHGSNTWAVGEKEDTHSYPFCPPHVKWLIKETPQVFTLDGIRSSIVQLRTSKMFSFFYSF